MSDQPSSAALAAVLVMVDALPVAGLYDLERALAINLTAAVTPREERVAELGFLAQLLQEHNDPRPWNPPRNLGEDERWPERPVVPNVDRLLYDERRPPAAPSSHDLVKHYGGWSKACRAAFGLREDGRAHGPGKPWHSTWGPNKAYTRAETLGCVRACALHLQRVPTTRDYYDWRRAEQRRAKLSGSPRRIATLDVIYRHFKTWPRAIAAAAITDTDLAEARRARGATASDERSRPDGPRAALAALTAEDLDRLGFDEEQAQLLHSAGFAHLPLSDAARIAAALGGSLDWLAERAASRGAPAPAVGRFDGQAFAELRRAQRVPETAVRELLDVPLGPYRKLLNGTWEPTLEMVRGLSELLSIPIGELVAATPEPRCGTPAR